jgi:hypothetical protein
VRLVKLADIGDSVKACFKLTDGAWPECLLRDCPDRLVPVREMTNHVRMVHGLIDRFSRHAGEVHARPPSFTPPPADLCVLSLDVKLPSSALKHVIPLVAEALNRGKARAWVDSWQFHRPRAFSPDAAKSTSYLPRSEHEELALEAIRSVLKRRAPGTHITMGRAYSAYANRCLKERARPRRNTQFWTYIQQLADLGLITARVNERGDGEPGMTTLISLPTTPPAAAPREEASA